MVERKIRQLVKNRLKHFPAVALLGPRQVGKTTLAKTLSPTYYDLELEEEKVRVDLQWPDLIDEHSLVVLDEAALKSSLESEARSMLEGM